MDIWRSGSSKRRKARKGSQQGRNHDVCGIQSEPRSEQPQDDQPTSRVVITRDIIWLGRMFFAQRDTKVTQQQPIVSVPISSVQALNETNNKVDTLEVTIQTPKEREGNHMDSSSEKTDGWTVHRTRSGRKVRRKDGQYNSLTGKTIM